MVLDKGTRLIEIPGFSRKAAVFLIGKGIEDVEFFTALREELIQCIAKEAGVDNLLEWHRKFRQSIGDRGNAWQMAMSFAECLGLILTQPSQDMMTMPCPQYLPEVSDLPEEFNIIQYTHPEKIRSQWYRGTCVSWATVNAIEAARSSKGHPYTPLSPHFHFSCCKRGVRNICPGDGFPNSDGTTMSAGVAVITKVGDCQEITCPYERRTPPHNPAGSLPKPAAFKEAPAYRAVWARSVPITVEAIKAAIVAGYVVIIGVPVYESWFNPYTNRYGVVPDPLGPEDRLLGGHAIALVGFDHDRFLFKNSWTENGEGWALESKVGYPGYGTISQRYIATEGRDAYIFEVPKPAERPTVLIRSTPMSTTANSAWKMVKVFALVVALLGLLLTWTIDSINQTARVEKTAQVPVVHVAATNRINERPQGLSTTEKSRRDDNQRPLTFSKIESLLDELRQVANLLRSTVQPKSDDVRSRRLDELRRAQTAIGEQISAQVQSALREYTQIKNMPESELKHYKLVQLEARFREAALPLVAEYETISEQIRSLQPFVSKKGTQPGGADEY